MNWIMKKRKYRMTFSERCLRWVN